MLAPPPHFIATRWIYLVALLLGIMQAITFDFAFDSPLRWLAPLLSILSLGGFLAIVRFLTAKRAMWFGYLFGLGVFAWGLNWVYISMARFGGASAVFAIGANIAVIVYLALYWLLSAYLIVKIGKTPCRRLLVAPAVIALLEWLRSVFLIGFPWLSIGYGFIDIPVVQFATMGGVFFVSFIVVALVALLLLPTANRYRLVACFIAVLTLWVAPQALKKQGSDGSRATVTLVQGNMPVITEYNNERMAKNLVQYHLLTEEALLTETPDVVIWAEAAIPYFYVEAREFLGDIYALQQKEKFDLVTGVPHANWEVRDIYNSVLLQKVTDPQPQFYNKSHLLPFGEYLPLRSLFAFFKDYVEIPMSDFSRGETVQPPFIAGGLSFAPSICFEAAFGNEIRQNAKQAQVLLNISNDAWFGQSKAQIQHLNITRMRAVENQKMLVRATNDGRTVIVDSYGLVLKSLPPFTAGTLTATIEGHTQQTSYITLYTTVGDWFILILSIGIVMIVIGFSARTSGYSDNRVTPKTN